MELYSLNDYTNDFFKREINSLKENYPGITLNRIIQELKSLNANIISNEQLNSIYFNLSGSVTSRFFDGLKKGIPLEYLTHKSYFYRSEFFVTEDVLIPRSETEILVELAVSEIRNKKLDHVKICDVGVGSGAIILSILGEFANNRNSLKSITASATDISEDALKVAKRNFFLQEFKFSKDDSITFYQTDRLKGVKTQFDLIVSNPPYIKKSLDSKSVHHQVNHYEPHIALYLEDSLYETWFHEFFKQVWDSLANTGIFLMEGHEDHLASLSEILKECGFSDVSVIKDYTDRNRFLRGIKICKN